MIRIVIENILLFLLPTIIYVAYVYLTSDDEKPGAARVLNDAPLFWLFIAGAALMLVTLVTFGSMSGGKPGQTYTPPVLKDGRIEPGHVD
jgi:hypothetical protein